MLHSIKTIGIDISEHVIRAVLVKKNSRKVSVIQHGEIAFEQEWIKKGNIIDKDKIQAAIKKLLFPSFHPHASTIVASLPESHAFLKTVTVDEVDKKHIQKEVSKHIPFPMKEIALDTIIHDGITVSFAAVKKEIAREYADLFQNFGHLRALEVESQAIARLFSSLYTPDSITVLCDIGKSHSTFLVIENNHIDFTHTSQMISGDRCTEQIKQELQISAEDAEQKKLNQSDDPTVQKAIQNHLGEIKKELMRVIEFHQDHHSTNELKSYRIILTGGGANITGISDHLKQEIRYPVAHATLPKHISVPKKMQRNQLSYATAIGCAMRDFHPL